MFDILEADIVIFQETKIQRKDLTDDMVLVSGWDCFFSLPRHKKGSLLDSQSAHVQYTDIRQATPELQSTPANYPVYRYVQKRASLALCRQ